MTLPDYGPPAPNRNCAVIDGPPGNAPCGRPPAWHIAWESTTPGEARTSLVCEQHIAFVQARFTYADRHQAGADCGRPGALWSDSAVGPWCWVPDDRSDGDQGETAAGRAFVAVERMQAALLFALHPDLQRPDE